MTPRGCVSPWSGWTSWECVPFCASTRHMALQTEAQEHILKALSHSDHRSRKAHLTLGTSLLPHPHCPDEKADLQRGEEPSPRRQILLLTPKLGSSQLGTL